MWMVASWKDEWREVSIGEREGGREGGICMMEGGWVGPSVGWIHERLCVEGYSSEITIFCRPQFLSCRQVEPVLPYPQVPKHLNIIDKLK